MIRTEDLAGLGVLAHPVGELVDVARGLQDLMGSKHGAVKLHHVLLEDEVLAPCVDNVGLESAAGRAIVVKAGNTAVELKSGCVKEAATEEGVEGTAIKGLAGLGGRHFVFGVEGGGRRNFYFLVAGQRCKGSRREFRERQSHRG